MKKSFKQIMLIDDNEIDTFVSTRLLNINELSENIIETNSVEEALIYLNEEIKKGNPLSELILLDLNMDFQDGYYFLEKFKSFSDSLKRDCKIIVLSSSQKEMDFSRIEAEPIVLKYFTKPLSKNAIQDLKALLQNSPNYL